MQIEVQIRYSLSTNWVSNIPLECVDSNEAEKRCRATMEAVPDIAEMRIMDFFVPTWIYIKRGE